jgi:hypothetical protein
MTVHIDNIALAPVCLNSSVSHTHLSVEDDTHDEDHKTTAIGANMGNRIMEHTIRCLLV